MNRSILLVFVLIVHQSFSQSIQSPDKRFALSFSLSASGEPVYQLTFNKKPIIKPGKLGLELKDHELLSGFSIAKVDSSVVDESWSPVWGEVKTIRNHYRELAVTLLQKETSRTMRLRF